MLVVTVAVHIWHRSAYMYSLPQGHLFPEVLLIKNQDSCEITDSKMIDVVLDR